MALIFMDLDGTALFQGKPVKGVQESIQKLKENGHLVAIATGRSPLLLYEKDKELGIDILVLANGSFVIVDGKVIHEKYIPSDVVKRMMDYSDMHQTDLVVEYIDEYISYRKDSDIADRFSDIFNIEKPRYDGEHYPDRNVFSMLVFNKDDVNDMKTSLPELAFNESNALGYDVNLKGELKAEGVKAVIDYLKYPWEETYAIGDGHNDITMLKAVRHGIAMGNATDEVKAAAEFVTTDVNDYGVANGLKHYGLI
ncbi:MAG TPA: Cof-type HAD-IIB family hydrolase [Bacillota bacterium]|nr:Cof-type HAD-IIB family hydrolase [Bacillota bacterium]